MLHRKDILSLAAFALVIALVIVLCGRIDSGEKNTETDMVREAIRNAALTCYAVEGVFPGDISYLRSHYGLQYDEERYFVVYDAFASNYLPDITVRETEANT